MYYLNEAKSYIEKCEKVTHSLEHDSLSINQQMATIANLNHLLDMVRVSIDRYSEPSDDFYNILEEIAQYDFPDNSCIYPEVLRTIQTWPDKIRASLAKARGES